MSNNSGIKSENMAAAIMRRKEGTSYCMNCGEQLAYCGKPFTAEIACQKCGALHLFRESQQPQEFKLISA
ncbi:MAG TPA: hypothetical protein VGF06_05045, partial [Terriglobales bacterium]|jgi:DNA-directed RNA polymerase subunit RPC12/RpoP